MNWYDRAGNLTWTGRAVLLENDALDLSEAPMRQDERRMYYAADGKVRAVDVRGLYPHQSAPDSTCTTSYCGYIRNFEEYRYDALGRRVVTRFDKDCDWRYEFNLFHTVCHIEGIRRTIWDGSQELGEIQVPLEKAEDDSWIGQVDFSPHSDYQSGASVRNMSPFYGAVAYVYDGQVDQPLEVTRIRYSDVDSAGTLHSLQPFTFFPLWDTRGQTDFSFTLATNPECSPLDLYSGDPVSPSASPCIWYVNHRRWTPYRTVNDEQKSWQGTLLEDKLGAAELMYCRNRYYDSNTGRFTQEDPLGLAGGLNLYGFANGDPVNFRGAVRRRDRRRDAHHEAGPALCHRHIAGALHQHRVERRRSDPFGLFACKDANGKHDRLSGAAGWTARKASCLKEWQAE